LRLQSEQLPTESQVFEEEALAGAKRADDPPEETPGRHNHGKNIIGTIRIQFSAKSFVLQMYDVFGETKQCDVLRSVNGTASKCKTFLATAAEECCPARGTLAGHLTSASIWHMLWHMPIKRRPVIREQHVKLFRNGRNQAVRIPREFELPGNDAIMRKEGERLIIEAAPPKSLLGVLDRLSPIDEQFPPIVELASDTVDL
jgi:antitoxin VapB